MANTRAVLSSYRVVLDNGDPNFVPYTELFIRQEVSDASGVIASSILRGVISHNGNIAAQMAAIDNQGAKNGYGNLADIDKTKLADHLTALTNAKV